MQYQLSDGVATLAFDDGKANAVGHDFIDGMNEGLDRAQAEAKAVIIRGRDGVFSGGFDLKEFQKGAEASAALALRGFELMARLFGHPQPVVAASTGHAVAAGAFLLLCADTRVGVSGEFNYCLPETAISMHIPPVLESLCLSRLNPRYLTAAIVQSARFTPQLAVDAGFLDELSEADELDSRTQALAKQFAELPAKFYGENKRALRRGALALMAEELARFKAQAGT